LGAGGTFLNLPDLQKRCCVGLRVCFVGALSKEARVRAQELECADAAGERILAFSHYRRSQVDYTVSVWILPVAGDVSSHHFAVEVGQGREGLMVPPAQVADTAGPLTPRALKQADFSSLMLSCAKPSGASVIHASGGFEFLWASHTTFLELPMRSPDQRFTVRGIRIADAEDRNYVILDVPGPTNETIHASCSLRLGDDVTADENLLEGALGGLSKHVASMVSLREG
jgi:hypothetical protein